MVNGGPGIGVGPDGDGCPRGIRLPQGSKEIEMTKKVKRLVLASGIEGLISAHAVRGFPA